MKFKIPMPIELIDLIKKDLSTQDIANYEIANHEYEFSDVSKLLYEGPQSFTIQTTSGVTLYYSKVNDYASKGICYTLPIAKPLQAIMHYGYYIHVSKILECFTKFVLHRIPKYDQGTTHNYIPAINDYPSHIHFLGHGKQFWCRHKASGREVPITPYTRRSINTDDWEISNIRSTWFGAWSTPSLTKSIKTGNFSLMDLLNRQPTIHGYHCPDPHTIQSSGKGAPDSSVSLEDGHINLICEGNSIKMDLDSRDLSKIPHEYVANKLRDSTDKRLSILGVVGEESALTPDEIDVDQKKVIELGTNRSEGVKSLYNDFNGKFIKYNYVLEPLSCNVYYLIVGITCVVTNLTLGQETVDDLCSRFKAGILMMNRVSEIMGYDVSGSVSTEDVKIGKAIMSEMNTNLDVLSTDLFPLNIIQSMKDDPTEEEMKHTEKVFKKCFDNSRVRIPKSRSLLENYIDSFKIENCQTHSKRITNIPMLFCNTQSEDNSIIDYWNSDLPLHLKKLWSSASTIKKHQDDIFKILDEARSNITPEVKHLVKKESIIRPDLTDDDKLELAKSGVGAKHLNDSFDIISKERYSKRSFSPLTNTSDIENFLKTKNLKLISKRFNPTIKEAVEKMKHMSTANTKQQSLDVWNKLIQYKIIGFFDQVTEIFQELSYNYKHWTIGEQFMVKTTSSGIKMIIKNTGSHIFVCFAYPKTNIEYMETGRLGPKLYASDNYVYTDFCSYNEPTLEHFMKSGPYMCSILIHLISKSDLDPLEISDHVQHEINMISLLFLNNKTDSEEIMTSQRYLFMKLFEDVTQDPYIFVDRLPEVLRSRLSVFLLQRCINLMDYYSTNRILKIPKVNNNIVNYDYLNIRSIVDMTEITLDNKINEFYYGYVVSKERGRGSDRNFKIIKKILQEEYKFRDSVNKVFEVMTDDKITYCTDPYILKVFLHFFRNVLKSKIGNDYEEIILNDFLNNLSFTNFTQIATLKASARDHTKPISVPTNLEEDRGKLLKSLNIRNKEEASKRPKVLESLIDITKKYQSEENKPIKHMMQLIPWCLKKLREKGYFDSDCFPKPQHGGDREIHVLEIMARIVQYTLELISRTISKYFISETITHPETKNNFVSKHYSETSLNFDKSFVISKSADASKWCQRHHVSHFAAMFIGITPTILHGFVLKTLDLWLKKKISFPLQLTATLLANKNTYSTNETFVRFRKEFYEGNGVFNEKMSNKIEIKSGMMQGILHYTSTLYHTMIQEVSKMLVVRIAKLRFKMNIICNIVQGSDDSGMMLGVEGRISKNKIINCYSLLRFKEEISGYMSVYWNECKSSIGTLDLIEYNSEWHVRHKVIKPTFRWISAALEVSVRERFIDGYRMFNQLITDCLEGGATALEVSVIQLNQVWMHCLLLGLNTSCLSKIYLDNILSICDPSLGFFPCDFDMSCGLPGVDFQLYVLSRNNHLIIDKIEDDTSIQYEFEGSDKKLIPKDLRSVKLKFGKTHLWKSLVDRLDLGTLEWALTEVENDPRILFGRHTSWEEEKPNLILKVFAPGVKESINNISSTLRMMASGSYILNRPCITIYENDTLKKLSLFSAVENKMLQRAERLSYNKLKLIHSCFPLHAEYEEFYKNLINITNDHNTFPQLMSRHSKSKIIVFEVNKSQHTLMDLCKRQWQLGGKMALSSKQFISEWSKTKINYPFLEDTIKATCTNLKMSVVELKNFLESLELKARTVTLYDAPVKQSGVMSAITRMYWPNVKIRSEHENLNSEMVTLKSDLFSLLTHWSSNIVTTRTAQTLIRNCRSLRGDFKSIPSKYKKLKTIFDWSNNKDKMDLVSQINEHKQGTLGYFSKPQEIINNKRMGRGIWIGQVVGIPTTIELNNEFVTKITIQRLMDSMQLGYALSLLIKEFKSEISDGLVGSNIWLSSSGKFVTKKNMTGIYIPVLIKSDLKVDIISDIETKPWKLEVGGTSIRLKMMESQGSKISYTILSETLSQRDWSESEPSKISDKSMRMWAQSVPMNASELDKNLSDSIPDSESEFNNMCRNIYNRSTLSEWNLGKFRERLLTIFVSSSESKKDFSESIIEPEEDIKTLEELNRLMNLVSSGFSEQEVMNMSWADSVKEDIDLEYSNNLDFQNINDDVINSIKSMMDDYEEVYSNPDQEQIDADRWRKMSQSNKFFDSLSQLSLTYTNKTILQNYEEAKKDPNYRCQGFLGKIISLMVMRLVVEGHDSHIELSDIASESSRQVNSIMDESSLNEIDYSNIQSTIEQLSSVYEKMTGTAAKELKKTIDRYKRIMNLKLSPTRTSDLEEINYSSFMNKMIEYLFSLKKTKYFSHQVETGLKLSLIKVEMIEYREIQLKNDDISNHEFSIFREYLNKNVCSNYLLDTLAECYNINIECGLYNIVIDQSNNTFKYDF